MNQKIIRIVLIIGWMFLHGAGMGEALAAGDTHHSVYIASYKSLHGATKEIKTLRENGYEAFWRSVVLPGKGKWYRVYTGNYKTPAEAERAIADLKSRVQADMEIVQLPAKSELLKGNEKKQRSKNHERLPESQRAATYHGESTEGVVPKQKEKIVDKGSSKDKEERIARSSVTERPPGEEKAGEKSAVIESENPLIDARKALLAGKYGNVLELMNKFVLQPSLTQADRGQALALMTIANYNFGKETGSKQHLLEVVDQYKILLRAQEDPTEGNDLLYFRMAECYEKLNFYYEAINGLDKLVNAYPSSSLIPEAKYKLGLLLIQTKRYDRASEILTDYVNRYPVAPHAREATFTIGDCYYRLHKTRDADFWFEKARNKWPDVEKIPSAILMNMADHYFSVRKYELAFGIFSLCANLYPGKETGKTSLYMMGNTARAMGKYKFALKLYTLFKERYREERQIDDCILAMANLGIDAPGIRFPDNIVSITSYLMPLQTYDNLLKKNLDRELRAEIMLSKGDALIKYDRLGEGIDFYFSCIEHFSSGKIGEEAVSKFNAHIPRLVDRYYDKGQYFSIAELYFQTEKKKVVLYEDFDTGVKIAASLLGIGLPDEAEIIFHALRNQCSNQEREGIVTWGEARIDIEKRRFDKAEAKLQTLLNKDMIKEKDKRNDIKTALADLYYGSAKYEQARSLYADVIKAGGKPNGDIRRKYAHCLQALHLSEQARVIYQELLRDVQMSPKNYDKEFVAGIYVGLGDVYYDENEYVKATEAYNKALPNLIDENRIRWTNFKLGSAYLAMNDNSRAETVFTKIKEEAPGEFWPKVTDSTFESAGIMKQQVMNK